MTLEQLRIFAAVAQQEHFTRAAKWLRMSQSSVSGAVAALEREFNVVLFDRTGRHVALTDAGNVLLAEAEAILARARATARRMEDLNELRSGRLKIAASQTAGNYWLPAVLNAFHDSYPGIAVDVRIGNSTQAENALLTGRVDLAVIERDPRDSALESAIVGADTLVVVVGARHEWHARAGIDWAELPQTDWVTREAGSGTRAVFEAALAANGVEPERLPVALVLRSGEAVRNVVANGACAAVLSNRVADVAIAAGLLHRLAPIAIERNYYALVAPNRPKTQALTVLHDYLVFRGATFEMVGAKR